MKKAILVIILTFNVVTSNAWANRDPTPIASCSSDQLQIYQVAISTPGMNQTRSLYGIINIAKTPCKLLGVAPRVWEVAKDGGKRLAAVATEFLFNNNPTIDREKNKSQPSELIVEPSRRANFIPGEKLAWFSVHGSAACEPGQNSYFPGFIKNKMIAIKLPTINDKTFFVSYSGYVECGLDEVTKLQKNISFWYPLKSGGEGGGGAECLHFIESVGGKLKVGNIFFKKLMYCD
jgi:hypothetical protein